MTSRCIATLAAVLLVTTTLLPSQQGSPTAAQSKQELAEGKFKQLTDRMQKMMVVLQKDEPEESKLLGVGLRFVQEKRLHRRLESAGAMLRQERWDESLVLMGKLREDLRSLLELLQNRDGDLRKLLARIDQLEGFRDRVDQLASEQQQAKEDSARAEVLKRHLEDIEAQRRRAGDLLNQQQALRDETNQLPRDTAAGATTPLAKKEGELQAAAVELSKDLRDLDKQDAALKADAKAVSKPDDAKPAGGASSSADASRGKSSDSAGQASASMGKAEEQLGAQQAEAALKDQDEAIAALDQTMKQLDAMAAAARRELMKLSFDQLAERQGQTEQATDALAKDMEQAEQSDQGGEGEPTPGKSKVQQAVPKQRAAAGKLKEMKPAKQKQQDAKDDLEAAKEALEGALTQLREQLQDEALRALEERFTAMLARQRELTLMTATVDASRRNILTADGGLPAALIGKIDAIAQGESELELETVEALKLLDEDGTTAVFPPMVEQLRDDLRDLVRVLRARQTGVETNRAQRDVEDLLELLINALRRTIEKKEGGG